MCIRDRHKTWCGSCRALKPVLANSQEFIATSQNFVMVNSEDDEAPHSDNSFQVDGGYIPRVYFLSPQGEVLTQYINVGGHPSYKYYYSDANALVASMNRVLSDFSQAPDRELH
eukprot:TRINITY_DN3077_c0_g1_i1.p1 TRINITY_DN3077_c0_g1~~TRINITY_DN3077_c0_g1_i1.p1  ORF type:complete len:114 (+),score=20.78 TRINITY_DN3077_c0_g1_i1:35-376(+)